MREILGDKAELGTVYFEGNPLQRRKREVYRTKVRLALPQVRQIDASESLFFLLFVHCDLRFWALRSVLVFSGTKANV